MSSGERAHGRNSHDSESRLLKPERAHLPKGGLSGTLEGMDGRVGYFESTGAVSHEENRVFLL